MPTGAYHIAARQVIRAIAMQNIIYLDYNASTPVDQRVVDEMLPFFTEHFGNPSSKGHPYGWAADEACELARERLAALIGADASCLTFTSGATEAVNMAVKGVAHAYASKGKHLITVETEHRAVLQSHRALEREGYEVSFLPVDEQGSIDLNQLAETMRDDTVLVSVMWANNEVGTIHPMREIAEIVHGRGTLLMSDATQAIGKIPVDVSHVDLLACSGHKFYAPKGVGALYMSSRSPRVRIVPLLDGGGHEDGHRSGTLNVPGIVGIGSAAEIAARQLDADYERLSVLRDRLERELSTLDGVHVNGGNVPRLPQTSSIRFEGARGADIMMEARDFAFSAGSACSSGNGRPSHVLSAMGLDAHDALATLRLSLGRFTTEDMVEQAIERLTSAVRNLRKKAVAAS